MSDIIEEYINKCLKEDRKTMAIKLLKDEIYPLNKIAELTELSMREVETLKVTIA